MVIAATDKKSVNEAVAKEARELKILVNTADNKENSDFFFPAIFSDEDIIGGMISNNGNNHSMVKEKAAKIRDFLKRGVLRNENNKSGKQGQQTCNYPGKDCYGCDRKFLIKT